MSKAEEYAEKFILTVDHQGDVEEAYNDGYEQAEEDLELSWEDIREIYCTTLNLKEHLGASVFGEPLYQEVLKRFNEERIKK